MCLGIPMQIREIEGFVARCEAKGVERDVSLFMMQDEALGVGDYVVVHVGYAIQKVTPQEARSAWEIYDEMLAKLEPQLLHERCIRALSQQRDTQAPGPAFTQEALDPPLGDHDLFQNGDHVDVLVRV